MVGNRDSSMRERAKLLDTEDDDKSERSLRSSLSRKKSSTSFPVNHSFVANASSWICSTKFLVLIILSLQNSLYTVLRRYSQGVLHEKYSKYELLLLGEIIKMLFSAFMIRKALPPDTNLSDRLQYLVYKSSKMVGLAAIYGAMNILSFVSLRNIGAGIFTIFAQCKILTTATFSRILLQRNYSYTKWRALSSLSLGVLLFTQPIWGQADSLSANSENASVAVGVAAVLIEVALSGFASIYFEKVIKTDPLQLSIWERNFQLAFGSFPVYIAFITYNAGDEAGLFGGWTPMAFLVSTMGAAGGLLVALSIKYGDAILKTLATTASIIIASLLDHFFMDGPLTPIMMIAAFQVVISICNYTFDATPAAEVVSTPLSKDSDRLERTVDPSVSPSTDIEVGDEDSGAPERRKQ